MLQQGGTGRPGGLPTTEPHKEKLLLAWLVGWLLPLAALTRQKWTVLPSCSAYAQRAVEGATKFPSNLGVGDG